MRQLDKNRLWPNGCLTQFSDPLLSHKLALQTVSQHLKHLTSNIGQKVHNNNSNIFNYDTFSSLLEKYRVILCLIGVLVLFIPVSL